MKFSIIEWHKALERRWPALRYPAKLLTARELKADMAEAMRRSK